MEYICGHKKTRVDMLTLAHIHIWLQISGTASFWLKVSDPSQARPVLCDLRGCADINGGFRA